MSDKTTLPVAEIPTYNYINRFSYGYLFGEPQKNTPMKNWVLKGIIINNNNNNFVIISSTDGNESIYKVGDKLSDGSIIDQIQFDHIILFNNNEMHTLVIPKLSESEIDDFIPPRNPKDVD